MSLNLVQIRVIDIEDFLDYCVCFKIQATIYNKIYKFMNRPVIFIFKLSKPIKEDDYKNMKIRMPSFDLYNI